MSTVNEGEPSRLLSLPFEIRRLIYHHVFDKEYIMIPHPQTCRYESDEPRPHQTVFYHPDPGNLRVYGINNASCSWVVQHVPHPEFMAARLDYDPPTRAAPRSGCSLDELYPFPLGATCLQLHAEVLGFIRAERATYAFSDFRSLIIWLKRTPPTVLALVRTVKMEVHLGITDQNPDGLVGGVIEDDEPWFDALKMARERLTGLRSFSLHAELCGPTLSETQTFGPFRRIPRASQELSVAFVNAAERMVEEARKLVPDDNAPAEDRPSVEEGGAEPSLVRRSGKLQARHFMLTAVQRYSRTGGPWTWTSRSDWRCWGREHNLGEELDRKIAALEIMPPWQLEMLIEKLNVNKSEEAELS